jgi:hypothetical protein
MSGDTPPLLRKISPNVSPDSTDVNDKIDSK